MKRFAMILISLMCFLVSCSPTQMLMDFPPQNEATIADKTFDKITSAINTQDDAKIVQLFSKNIQNEIDELQQQSRSLLDFIEGNIVSVSAAKDSGVGSHINNNKGKTIKEIESAFTVETTERTYHFFVRECIKDESDDGAVGLLCIYIIDAEDWAEDFVYRGDGEQTRGIIIVDDKA